MVTGGAGGIGAAVSRSFAAEGARVVIHHLAEPPTAPDGVSWEHTLPTGAVLADARAHGPVVLVTDATTRLESDVDALGLARHVDAIVNSARLGVAKPESAIYLAAAEVPPERCLFVDDSATNVAAARTLGMAGHHFTDVAGFRALLATRGSRPRAARRPGRGGTPPPGPSR